MPYLTYGVQSCFGAPRCETDRVRVLPRKAMRCIYDLGFNSPTNATFKNNQILKLDELYKLKVCSLVFYYLQNCGNDSQQIASCLMRNYDIHDYNTRSRNNLVLKCYNRAKSQHCFLYQGASLWNSLPECLRDSQSIISFKVNLKKYYCSLY